MGKPRFKIEMTVDGDSGGPMYRVYKSVFWRWLDVWVFVGKSKKLVEAEAYIKEAKTFPRFYE